MYLEANIFLYKFYVFETLGTLEDPPQDKL